MPPKKTLSKPSTTRVVALPLYFFTLIKVVVAVLFLFLLTQKHYTLATVVLAFVFIEDLDDTLLHLNFDRIAPQYWKFLNTVTNRVVDITIISAFSFSHLVPWFVTIPLIACSFVINYARHLLICCFPDTRPPIGLIERTERMIGIFIAMVMFLFSQTTYGPFNILEIMLTLVLALSIITATQILVASYSIFLQKKVEFNFKDQ